MNPRRTDRPVERVENLEARTLLATINVASFGAFPNDGADDSYQIQRAINAAGSGDTIQFGAGVYNLGRAVDPKGGNRILRGAGTTLQTGADNFAFSFHGDGLTITGFKIKGRGIFMDKPAGGMVSNVKIDDNTFDLYAPSGSHRNSIEFTTGLRNVQITNNYFDSINGDNGVYGYYWDGLTIANNAFYDGNEGIHVIDHSNSSRDLLIEQNHFSGLRRMGIEYQGGGYNSIIQDNYYEKPVFGNKAQNDGIFAYSIIADRSVGTIVRRNTAISLERPDGVGVRVAIEIGGDNALVEENYIIGTNHVLAANDMNGTTSVLVRNNRWSQYLQGPSGRGITFQGVNGPDAPLSWDINRGIPGPHKRFGNTPITPPPPTPVPETDGRPTNLRGVAVGTNRIDLTWDDNSDDEIGFRIERSFDGTTWAQIALLIANTEQFSNTGLPANTKIWYRVRAFNATGETQYSNTLIITTGSGSSSTPTTPPTTGGNTPSTGTTTTRPSGSSTYANEPIRSIVRI